ncbi:hypothetical protein C900_03763 [Fulvivirga imtechensis AK7]|uniref:Uncharacterized protein n=1 Tax=Fulvivirga imtechensis AK7 TaxID=1237149 RepID=L8JSE0_9BACT|nr:PAS domain-containing protein [Fulvivirga imtechensis]ELR70409.1 hypothetical protein C900_03763 [Fulvivirga imtechensis AK7]
MKLDFQDLSLGKQAVVIFAGFIVLAAINFFVMSSSKGDLRENARKIEAARELQLLPEQISSAATLYINGDQAAKSRVQELAKSYERKLNLFTEKEEPEIIETTDSIEIIRVSLLGRMHNQWNKVSKNIQDLLFEPAQIDTIVQEVKEIPLYDSLNTITTETTQKILTIANPRVERANNYLQASVSELSDLAKRLVARQKNQFKDKSAVLTYIPLAFLCISIALVVFLLTVIYKKVYRPILELDKVANHVSQGDLSKKSEYTANNEIGKIARSINKITDNLRNATAFINNIENGKLDEEFKGVNEKDVSQHGLEGALLTMRDQMKRVEEEERERKWSTEGLAKFVDILRSSNDDVYTLGDVIISNLVKYTHSNQGGIYVLNDEHEDNKYLELISLFAFDTKKYDKSSYRIGEGLVGQTFQERETIYLIEVPHEYITITSGLGGANPKSILLVPLKVNEDIYGVIELASFEEYKTYEIEFVEKLAESIASTIAGVKNNQRTRQLLEESQALTEQMQAQEEEMRQNMEELSATQEEMSRKEVEMTAQLTAINNSLSTAEFDMKGTLMNANLNYIKLLGYQQIDEISELPFASLSNEDNSGLWNTLRDGTSQSGQFKKRKKSGEEINVNATFTPVKNKNGELYKVIELILSVETASTSPVVDKEELKNMKEVEEELRQNLEELEITQEQLDQKLKLSEAALNSIDQVVKIISLQADGRIININKAVENLTGYSNSELAGQPVDLLVEEDFLQDIEPGATARRELNIKSQPEPLKAAVEISADAAGSHIYLIWI